MRDMMMESSLEDASCPKDFVGADHGVWRMEALRASNTPCEEKCRPGDVVARLSAMSVALPPTDGFECFPAAYIRALIEALCSDVSTESPVLILPWPDDAVSDRFAEERDDADISGRCEARFTERSERRAESLLAASAR